VGSDERRSEIFVALPVASEGAGPGDSADTSPNADIISTRRITAKIG
jgi:hypothetical protein